MIYLASRSPQRKRLLEKIGIPFKVVPTAYRERIIQGLDPCQNAIRNALGKAFQVRKQRGIILAADTLVAFRGKIIGKAGTRNAAARLLASFSGQSQWVYTGVALRNAATGRVLTFCEKSLVKFRKMSSRDIARYLDTGEYREKAGAFTLEGAASRFIRSVRGSRSNVIGLPLERVKQLLGARLLLGTPV